MTYKMQTICSIEQAAQSIIYLLYGLDRLMFVCRVQAIEAHEPHVAKARTCSGGTLSAHALNTKTNYKSERFISLFKREHYNLQFSRWLLILMFSMRHFPFASIIVSLFQVNFCVAPARFMSILHEIYFSRFFCSWQFSRQWLLVIFVHRMIFCSMLYII